MKPYYKLFGDIPDGDYDGCVAFLEKELRFELTAAYEQEFVDAEVRHFNDAARRLYTLYFDCTEDYESTDIYSRAARVVFVYGRSAAGTKERDSKRMRQFLGTFKNQPEYVGYDKGHFIAHCNDGQIDQNLYPQLKELNRGLSPQGKLFRSMERYLQRNEGVFYFVRPIYNDLTWIPHQIDFGIFTKEKGLLLNRFDNRKPNDAV
ncbi:DNA/RNA non-specific endonuclease [Mucilaginibacter sp. UR6-11]|uniref:DNA/RNA non-specific endonuclease n=1 Tax=Mucilaginibacter sp. UR6-11 TaxID=1435644 RepID=UPI001E3B2E82|nr:DNA/RNA non-specific endonuclease [Mucilaginibacter sp. UR6-11]MCC8423578.1 DNA/RNA non-specific endonuclease [Mucilaginibacter sp. UR6-11]